MALTASGMPYPLKTPYKPSAQYNPMAIASFIQSVAADSRLSVGQRKCLVKLAGGHLVAGSVLRNGARWFGYRFTFSAHPGVPALRAPWYSGLAQASAFGALLAVNRVTGDSGWLQYARETFAQFLVPIEKGGTTSRKAGRLWFEEYPTSPPTTVLNGHLEAIIGLDNWYRASGDRRASALRDEALDDLQSMLAASEVPVPGGTLSSYELLRGRGAASLRLVTNAGFVLKSASIGGKAVSVPRVARVAPGRNLVVNGSFSSWTRAVPSAWTYAGDVRKLKKAGGAASLTTTGTGWQTLQQVLPAGRLAPGRTHTLTVSGRVDTPAGRPGESGQVAVYSRCSRGGTKTLAATTALRGTWARHVLSFVAPAAGCSVLTQVKTGDYRTAGTTVTVDDVEVRTSDAVGAALTPAWDLFVWRTPTSRIAMSGAGTATLEAYAQGRWRPVTVVTLSATARQFVVPERLTGRNLHYGYHQAHVAELMSLNHRTRRPYLLDYARRWVAMAPAQTAAVPRGR